MKVTKRKKVTWQEAMILMSYGNFCICKHNTSEYIFKCDGDDHFRMVDEDNLTFLNSYVDKDDILQGEWYFGGIEV